MNVHHQPLSFGAELGRGGARFRLWAPSCRQVELCLEGRDPLLMPRDDDGFCELFVEGAGVGQRYRYRIDDELDVPDAASRCQPEGVHGPSEIVDPGAYRWKSAWRGRPWHETVLYELHLGTFTEEGTFAAALGRLGHLVELGVTAVELMPVAEAPGARNWGYDGVCLFAPHSAYGPPDDLKRLVDEAHRLGLSMFLDVVYNHFGPEGNYLYRYANDMFTDAISTPWGSAIAVDGPQRQTVRRFFIENALFWLEEYRFDGLRFDAVHAIPREGKPTFVEELAEEVRRRISERSVHLVLENDDNRASLLGDRYDAQWNDDFHHAAHVLLTEERDGYYRDYQHEPLAHLGRCLAEGFAYQGESSLHRGGRPRGQPSASLPPTAFVDFLQNHDQVGNRAFGERLHTLSPPEALEAATTLLLLAPAIPLLFMGEEWSASTPFLFFCDFEPGLRDAVREGRRSEFESFAAFKGGAQREIPDPGAPATMTSSTLRWDELSRAPHSGIFERHRALLALRRRELMPRLADASPGRHDLAAGLLRVTWQLGDATYGVAVTAGREAAWSLEPAARVIATTSNVADASGVDKLRPWSVVWWLRQEEAARG